jgi:transposase-like protein
MGEAEIVTRRRKWTAEQKATLLAEVEAEGGRVSIVAKRHGLSESLLYNWRSSGKEKAATPPEPLEFVPIGVFSRAVGEASELTAPNREQPRGEVTHRGRVGIIEIELSGGARISVDAFVNEKALARVFRTLKDFA